MGVPNPGTLALVGAGEFLPPIAPVGAMLLERVDGTPHVVVLPTASAPDGPGVPERCAKFGIDHFFQLGASAEALMLLEGGDPANDTIVPRITAPSLVYCA